MYVPDLVFTGELLLTVLCCSAIYNKELQEITFSAKKFDLFTKLLNILSSIPSLFSTFFDRKWTKW